MVEVMVMVDTLFVDGFRWISLIGMFSWCLVCLGLRKFVLSYEVMGDSFSENSEAKSFPV